MSRPEAEDGRGGPRRAARSGGSWQAGRAEMASSSRLALRLYLPGGQGRPCTTPRGTSQWEPRLRFLLWQGPNRMRCGPVRRGETVVKPRGPSPSREWGVGRGTQVLGHFAPWFLEDPGSGSLPCFVSPLSGALDSSPGLNMGGRRPGLFSHPPARS